MNVLIACEESQEVCKAFRAKGHNAYSCDIQEPSGGHPEWHILGDAVQAMRGASRDAQIVRAVVCKVYDKEPRVEVSILEGGCTK